MNHWAQTRACGHYKRESVNRKNVLILEGSPRWNGNSAILSDEFVRGAEEMPGAA